MLIFASRTELAELRADKLRLLADLQRERIQHDAEVKRLTNDVAVLQGQILKLKLERDRLEQIVSTSTRANVLAKLGITEREAKDVDWERMGMKDPA